MSSPKGSAWISMWCKPRETLRQILSTKPTKGLWILSFLYGWPMALQLFAGLIPFSVLVISSLFLAPFLGLLAFGITSLLLFVTGRWFNGKASLSHILTAVAWSNVTNVISCISWVWLIFTFRETIFSGAFREAPISSLNILLLLIFTFAQLAAGVWTLCLLLFSLAEVQGFSLGRAALNVASSMLVVLAFVGVFLALLQNARSLGVG